MKRTVKLAFWLLIFTINTSAQTKKMIQIASGVWKMTIGKPEKINLTSELTFTPKLEAINHLEKAILPIKQEDIKIQLIDGKTYLKFPLEKGEKIFGLGLNFKTVEQRGRIMRLHVDHYGQEDNGRTHAPVPFFVSSRGYGAFVNSARYLDIWVSTAVERDSPNAPIEKDRTTDKTWEASPYSDNIAILIPAQGVDLTLFAGKTMLDVVRRFNLLNGGGALPPRWGLGFWHRVPTPYTADEVNQEVAEFEEKGFPISVIGLEPGWQSKAYPCTYEWDKTRFPKPEKFVQDLLDRNVKLNLWINPYISKQSDLYSKIKPFSASHTVWGGIIPDYTMPVVKKAIADHFEKNQLNLGISGFKMDENDGYDFWLWPDVATFPSGIAAEQFRQTFGSIMQSVTTAMYHKQNKRTYSLVRAGNAGTSSYNFAIYNDGYNHKDFVTAMVNSSFIGVLWTPEVRSSKTAEEWVRRMQTVCFSPLAQLNAWSDGTKPWSFPEVTNEVKAIAELRMQLIPYLYSAFADYSFSGTPPIRAMNLEEGYGAEIASIAGKLDAAENPYAIATKKEVKDQFMVGENLLVAPIFTGQKERTVILPKGKWFDFYTGVYVGQGEVITIKAELATIPVFVKDGGIVPMGQSTTKIKNEKMPLEIRYYGTKPVKYSLYDDDGETYNYEKGEYTQIAIEVKLDANKRPIGSVSVPKGKKVWSFSEYNFRYMTVK